MHEQHLQGLPGAQQERPAFELRLRDPHRVGPACKQHLQEPQQRLQALLQGEPQHGPLLQDPPRRAPQQDGPPR